MVKRKIFIVLILLIIILNLFNIKAFGKTNHFKAFITHETHYDNSSLPSQTIRRMVNIMEALEYVNYTGTGMYSVTDRKADILSYINMSGQNYGFAIVSHADQNGTILVNGTETIVPSEITGYWHLVLCNACSSFNTDAYARAFKTVGYSHRASIGFSQPVSYFTADQFWSYVNKVICSTTLRNVVDYAVEYTEAPAVLYGDGSWNGYAWN